MIAPSILSADFRFLAEQLRLIEEGGADLIHVDVMDGHFVPNITIGPFIVETIDKSTDLPIDVHLMIENPQSYIDAFAQAGADWISVHAEICPNLLQTIKKIKGKGIKAGLALNPDTPIDTVKEIIAQLDFVLVMSVYPGFSGQKFIPESLEKIKQISEMIRKNEVNVKVEVDGGINDATAMDVCKAGADVLVAGHGVFRQPDIAAAIARLKGLADRKS